PSKELLQFPDEALRAGEDHDDALAPFEQSENLSLPILLDVLPRGPEWGGPLAWAADGDHRTELRQDAAEGFLQSERGTVTPPEAKLFVVAERAQQEQRRARVFA